MTPKLRERCLTVINPYKTTIIVVVLMFSLYYIWMMDYLFIFTRESPSWLWLQLFLFILTVFSCRRWIMATIVWLALSMLILHANKIKCDLLLFPVTETDLKILTSNPVGFLDAIGISRSYQYAAGTFAVAISGVIALWKLRTMVRHDNHKRLFAELAVLALLIVIAYNILNHFYLDYGDFVFDNQARIFERDSLWQPEGIVLASNRLSAIGFIPFSHSAINQTGYSAINRIAPAYRAADPQTVTNVAAQYLPSPRPVNRQLPNIVFILAESTFDPNIAFRLDRTVTNSLFTPTEEEEGGQLHVSAIGGGTWKTEFETITGIDARLFGFAGEYTHVSLSPFIRQSFATYLKQKGYDTRAYYPVRGNFYSAKTAYHNYGFNRFDDATDLNLEHDWTKFSDELMVEKVLNRLPDSQDKPIFAYLLTLQGHSPYPCKHFDVSSKFPVRFTGDASFIKNCKLNEFILNIASTERAVAKVAEGLRAIEKKTGRPFLLVVFGDHQPLDLVNETFNKNRREFSQNHTFYKIIKSDTITLPPLEKEFHTTLIPTLVSTAVADNAEQIYMPENFYVYDRCGTAADLAACPDLSVLTKAYKEYIKMDLFK